MRGIDTQVRERGGGEQPYTHFIGAEQTTGWTLPLRGNCQAAGETTFSCSELFSPVLTHSISANHFSILWLTCVGSEF